MLLHLVNGNVDLDGYTIVKMNASMQTLCIGVQISTVWDAELFHPER